MKTRLPRECGISKATVQSNIQQKDSYDSKSKICFSLYNPDLCGSHMGQTKTRAGAEILPIRPQAFKTMATEQIHKRIA